MTHSIVTTRVIADDRDLGEPGIVIGEHVFDDGQVWPAVFECLANENALTRLQAMIERREAERLANEAAGES